MMAIDNLEALWRITDKDIPCYLYIVLKRNNPQIFWYFLLLPKLRFSVSWNKTGIQMQKM